MQRLLIIAIPLITLVFSGCFGGKDTAIKYTPSKPYLARGKELATGLAACGFCHGEKNAPTSVLAGGREAFDRYGSVSAPNLTTSKEGLAGWETNQIVQAIRRGNNPEVKGQVTDAHLGFEWLSDPDAYALAGYLQTLEPSSKRVARRNVSFMGRKVLHAFAPKIEKAGYVPAISPKFRLEYGRYLTDNVARCAYCHNREPSLFQAGEYLAGGQLIKTDAGEKYAPGIAIKTLDDLASWSEDQIVAFLQNGETPGGVQVDPEFCPVEYFSNAHEQDLRSIAAYLKSLS